MTTNTRLTILLLCLALQLADALTTALALDAGAVEGNVLPAAVLASHGEAALYALKAAGVLVMAGILWRLRSWPGAWRCLRWSNVAMLLVVAVNTTAIG